MTDAAATQLAQDLVADCPTTRYLVVSQPHINAADLTTRDGVCAVPNLCRAMDDARVQTKVTVAEVFGALSAEDLAGYIRTTCILREKEADVRQVTLAALPAVARADVLADNDYLLRDKIEDLVSDDSYTIVYLAGRPESSYEAEFSAPVQMDLRKRLKTAARHVRREVDHSQSLFDKYQFFTPGIFVGLFTAIVLLGIFTLGLRGLASLEVPYGAFTKEMGPGAQKKQ
jgi:hypothetical protein